MRQSQKAWLWARHTGVYPASVAELAAAMKDAGEQGEQPLLNGRRRSLLPRA